MIQLVCNSINKCTCVYIPFAVLYGYYVSFNEAGKVFYLAGCFNGCYFAGFGGVFCCMLSYLKFIYKKQLVKAGTAKVSPVANTVISTVSGASKVEEEDE